MIQHQRRAHGEEGTEQSGSPGAQEGAENGSPTSKEGPELPTHPAAPTERSQAAQLSPPSPHPQMWHFWLWMQRRGAARSIVALRSVAQCGAGGCKGGKGLQRETPPPQRGLGAPRCGAAAPPALHLLQGLCGGPAGQWQHIVAAAQSSQQNEWSWAQRHRTAPGP